MVIRPPFHPIHRVGLALVAALSVWIVASAIFTGRSPLAMLSVLGICTASYSLGRIAARHVAMWAFPAAVVVGALAVVLKSPSGTFSFLSGEGFLGYANAKAAFFVQAAFAAVVIFARNRSWKIGLLLLPAFGLFLAIPVASLSLGAFVSALLVAPAVFVAVFRLGHRPLMISALALVALCFLSSLLMSRAFSNGFGTRQEQRIAESLDTGRARAWGDAYGMLSEHPAFGVGPGGFGEVSPVARQVSDLRWAHNEFLQVGAETGIVGLLLLLTLIAWMFMRLSTPLAGSSTVVALAVAALAAHACADYILHFPVVPAIVSGLVGSTPLRGPRIASRTATLRSGRRA